MEAITVDIMNKEGKKAGTMSVPGALFGLPSNDALVYQVYTVKRSNQRRPYAHTKDRSEVRGGGRKPWRQKGTGRARHGSRRSPLWVGGGITFGPRNERNFTKKINTKMNRKAIATVLSAKARDNAVVVFDSLSFEKPNTKGAISFLDAAQKRGQSVLVFGSQDDEHFVKSFRNIERATPRSIQRVSLIDLLNHKNCIFSKNALELLITQYANTNEHTTKSRQGVKERPVAKEAKNTAKKV